MKTESAKCAKEIRQLLKNQIPGIKFRIKSENYAGGNSVRVYWNLGQKAKTVEKLINKYAYGHFDGMHDIYEYDNNIKGTSQAKYVFCRREYLTAEEIENNKLKYSDPNRRDLWTEEKTLYHVVGRDLCRAMNIKFEGLETTIPPKEFQHIVTGYNFDASINAFCYQLLAKTEFLDGYHGVKNELTEDGQKIPNSFILY